MTKREVIRTLLDKKLPDRVGLNESFWPFIIENAWGAQGMPPQTDFITRFNLDIRSFCWCCVPEPRPDLAAVVEESDEWIVKTGWLGKHVQVLEGEGGHSGARGIHDQLAGGVEAGFPRGRPGH